MYDPSVRIAWFSPLPPVRSGIAAYSIDVLPQLAADFAIECFVAGGAEARSSMAAAPSVHVFDAYDFIWRAQLTPYDLVVYQLGNAPCHDYMWAYLARYPGLVVLHDIRLHHARARRLLSAGRFDDYRREFAYDQPDAPEGVAEYSVEGLGGAISYLWPMVKVVMRTAKSVAVHSAPVAAALRAEYPSAAIHTIRMGVPQRLGDDGLRIRLRQELDLPADAVVFALFGKVTAEKRVSAILHALSAAVADGVRAYLVIVGDAIDYPTLTSEIQAAGLEDRVRLVGYADDRKIGGYLTAADVCLCLRWPTAQETSASWLRCLAAARPTIVSDLAHLADVPTVDLRSDAHVRPTDRPVAARIDLLDEEGSLRATLTRLASDEPLRLALAEAGHDYWSRQHTVDVMAADYRRVIRDAAGRPIPTPTDLPAHFSDDHSALVRRISQQFNVDPWHRGTHVGPGLQTGPPRGTP
jgi:glycosyltransferase involved in cell wall biosynthesis